jgi:hypothetical protein
LPTTAKPTWIHYLLSPAVLLAIVWCGVFVGFYLGPIRYDHQPTLALLGLVVAGYACFATGCALATGFARVGAGLIPGGRLAAVVAISGALGIAGIVLLAFDRLFLSGIDGALYAAVLRCSPDLVDQILLTRTPLLYVGYLLFSFAYASTVLFWIYAEDLKGVPAWIGQWAVITPIGYSLLYAGRLPLLLLVALLMGASAARFLRRKSFFPRGHSLAVKAVVALVLILAYSNAIWDVRRSLCEVFAQEDGFDTNQPITANDLKEIVALGEKSAGTPVSAVDRLADFREVLGQSWSGRLAGYVEGALAAGVPEGAIISSLRAWFYVSQSPATMARIFQYDGFSRYWGFYQIGVLSPIERIFLPSSHIAETMEGELKESGVFGFFASSWGAAYLDFGLAGAAIFLLAWGILGGLGWRLTRDGQSATGALLFSFVVASVFLSPMSGPLGLANSALVLGAFVVAGFAADLRGSAHSAPAT